MALTVIRDVVSSTITLLVLDSDPAVAPGTVNPNPDPDSVLLVRTDAPSIYRKFGAGATDWVLLGGATSSGAANTCLIFRPGGALNGPTVFNSWASLINQLSLLRVQNNGGGCYTIQFDDSLVTPCVVPAGAYDMANVTWEGVNRSGANLSTAVSLADGVTLTALLNITNFLSITGNNTLVPNVTMVNGDTVKITGASNVNVAAGLMPFFDATAIGAAGFGFLELRDGSSVGLSDTGAVFNFPTVGSSLFVTQENDLCFVAPSVLAGAVGATLIVATDSMANINRSNTAWLGTVSTPRLDEPASFVPRPYNAIPAVAPIATPLFGQWLRLNAAGGAILQLLPAISFGTNQKFHPGCIVIVTETSGTIGLTVQGTVPDTINGAGAAIPVPPGGTIILISDGISDWRVIASPPVGDVYASNGFPYFRVTPGAVSLINGAIFTTPARRVTSPGANVALAVVGDQIPPQGQYIRLNNTSGGALVLASTPTIPDGVDGERITLLNISADAVSLQDEGTLPGSNLYLSGAAIVLGVRDNITLVMDSFVGGWVQTSQVNVL